MYVDSKYQTLERNGRVKYLSLTELKQYCLDLPPSGATPYEIQQAGLDGTYYMPKDNFELAGLTYHSDTVNSSKTKKIIRVSDSIAMNPYILWGETAEFTGDTGTVSVYIDGYLSEDDNVRCKITYGISFSDGSSPTNVTIYSSTIYGSNETVVVPFAISSAEYSAGNKTLWEGRPVYYYTLLDVGFVSETEGVVNSYEINDSDAVTALAVWRGGVRYKTATMYAWDENPITVEELVETADILDSNAKGLSKTDFFVRPYLQVSASLVSDAGIDPEGKTITWTAEISFPASGVPIGKMAEVTLYNHSGSSKVALATMVIVYDGNTTMTSSTSVTIPDEYLSMVPWAEVKQGDFYGNGLTNIPANTSFQNITTLKTYGSTGMLCGSMNVRVVVHNGTPYLEPSGTITAKIVTWGRTKTITIEDQPYNFINQVYSDKEVYRGTVQTFDGDELYFTVKHMTDIYDSDIQFRTWDDDDEIANIYSGDPLAVTPNMIDNGITIKVIITGS